MKRKSDSDNSPIPANLENQKNNQTTINLHRESESRNTKQNTFHSFPEKL